MCGFHIEKYIWDHGGDGQIIQITVSSNYPFLFSSQAKKVGMTDLSRNIQNFVDKVTALFSVRRIRIRSN